MPLNPPLNWLNIKPFLSSKKIAKDEIIKTGIEKNNIIMLITISEYLFISELFILSALLFILLILDISELSKRTAFKNISIQS